MTTRSAVIATIALIVGMMGLIGFGALFAGDIPERAGGIVTTILAGFGTVLTGLLLYLRLETVNSKADTAAVKADTAADAATQAAKKSAVIESKVDAVRHDIHNDVLVQKVIEAVRRVENDPDIQAQRIDRIAKGVQKDRHDKAQRETSEQGWAEMERRGIPRPQQPGGEGA